MRAEPTVNRFLELIPEEGESKELAKYIGIYSAKIRGYLLPARMPDVEQAQKVVPLKIPDEVIEWMTERDSQDRMLQTAPDYLGTRLEHEMEGRLYPHQRAGVQFLSTRSRAILAASPGLGKTATAVVAADVVQAKKILVVAPLTLLHVWEREIGAWSTEPLWRNLRTGEGEGDRWHICNPERLMSVSMTVDGDYDLIIVDESILYKNRNAKRSKFLATIVRPAKRIWLLSGAPVTNFVDDLWMQLHVLAPDVFTSYWKFVDRWCITENTPWGTRIVANKNPEGLRHYLRDILWSRTPDDLEDFPDLMLEVIPLSPTPAQEKALKSLRDTLQVSPTHAPVTTALELAQQTLQLSNVPRMLDIDDDGAKVKAVREMVDWLPHKTVFWVYHTKAILELNKVLKKTKRSVDMIHGNTPVSERSKILDEFENGSLDYLILQINTGRYGLSLNTAQAVVFVERTYSYDDWVQATARVRRLNTGRSVPSYVLDVGWGDKIVNQVLAKKIRSVSSLQLSDIKSLLGTQKR